MKNQISEAILELIKKDRKIHKSTEEKLDREKFKTEVYNQLSVLYERDILKGEIQNKDLLIKHGLLDKDHLIEYVRFKFISMKIDIVGENNPISTYKILEHINPIGDDESYYSLYVDEDYKRIMTTKFAYTLNNINIENLGKSDVINSYFTQGELNDSSVDFINSMLERLEIDSQALSKKIKKSVYDYLILNRPKIPLHNLEQAIHIYKIQNLDETKEINRTLKLLKSSKVSLDKLNFSNERMLINYLYEEIEKRPGRLKNLQYYMLERSMLYEAKKISLSVLNKIEKKYENINREDELMVIIQMTQMKDIFTYDKLGKLYLDSYPNHKLYLKSIDTINNIIGKWLSNLQMWENSGWIQTKDVLDEIEIFPRLCNTKEYRNQYRIRKDFNKLQYQTFNKLVSDYKLIQNEIAVRKYKDTINQDIMYNNLIQVVKESK